MMVALRTSPTSSSGLYRAKLVPWYLFSQTKLMRKVCQSKRGTVSKRVSRV